MFRTSLNLKTLIIAAATVVISTSLPLHVLRADIIEDIDTLEKEKPEKEKEKKKEKDKEQPSKPKTHKPKEKSPSDDLLQPDDKSQLIPEPLEETIIPPPLSKPNKTGGKSKGKTKEQRQKAPVHFQNSGTTIYTKDRSTVVLDKNVIITQDDMRLESDEAKINLNPKDSKSSAAGGGVKSALLTGKVAISRYSDDPSERMNAKSDKALFDNQAQTVSLEGNARLWREGNLIKGDRIIYEMASGMIKVDKAQGVVQPERMNK